MKKRSAQASNPRSAKNRWLLSLGFMGLLLLFSHQNCAPPAAMTSISDSAGGVNFAPEPDRAVGIIDGGNDSARLQFAFSDLEIASTAEAAMLSGQCLFDQDGAVLSWFLSEVRQEGATSASVQSGAQTSGQVVCQQGQFTIEISSADLVCARSYRVVARLGLGAPAEVVIRRLCSL